MNDVAVILSVLFGAIFMELFLVLGAIGKIRKKIEKIELIENKTKSDEEEEFFILRVLRLKKKIDEEKDLSEEVIEEKEKTTETCSVCGKSVQYGYLRNSVFYCNTCNIRKKKDEAKTK